MSVTYSKLSSLQDLFGDSILTRQHFAFSEKHAWDLFQFLEITRFCVRRNASPPCVINMKIFFHVWNLIKFKGQKNH